jgi:putative SOS response-associated peptidase YedK
VSFEFHQDVSFEHLLQFLTFGFPMPWDEKKLLINAKSKNGQHPADVQKAFRESQCLVPTDVFFEWKLLSDGKQPYAFARKDSAVFSFAGLSTEQGFVILTTRPNHLMEDVHTKTIAGQLTPNGMGDARWTIWY